MNKKRLVLVLLLFMGACSVSNDDSETPLENEITELEALKTRLSSVQQAEQIITSFSSDTQNDRDIVQLNLDNQETVILSASLIDSLAFDSDAWRLRVIYSDETDIELFAVGEKIFRSDQFSVQLNPSGNNPLAALVTIDMPVPGKFNIEVVGKTSFGISITHEFDDIKYDHELPILGLYQNYENEIVFEYESSTGTLLQSESYFITTARTATPDVDVNINNLPQTDEGIFFNTDLKMGFDQRGEIRWIWTHPAHYVFRKLQNGNLIISSNESMIMYHTRRFYEVSMLGEIIQTYETPNYQHHEIRELPNGNFLVSTNSTPLFQGSTLNQEDFLIEYDRTTGSNVQFFDFNLILDNQRPHIPGERTGDWLHNNAIYYDSDTNALIMSGRAQSAVVSIDYTTKEVNWIISHPSGWTGDLANKTLTPVDESGTPINVSDEDFWPYGQHAAMTLPNGNIFMYDNGRYRGFYDSPSAPASSYSRAVEYRVDAQNMTIEKVWEFDHNKTLFTPFTGDVDYFPENDHRLISFMWGSGDTPRFFELDENDNIVFEATVNRGNNNYRMEKIYLYDGMD